VCRRAQLRSAWPDQPPACAGTIDTRRGR
jgi:hypothetical protein